MKYMGSKARVKKEILPIIQDYINNNNISTYIEPFAGGCNIIDDIVCDTKIANDNNEFLIEMLSNLSFQPSLLNNKVFDDLHKIEYDECRNRFKESRFDDTYPKWYIGTIGFLGSYNGRFYDGGYAKPVISKSGKERNYFKEAKRNMQKQLPKLKEVKFYNEDYKYFSNFNNCVIYCDPPYKNTKQYGTSKEFNHNEFWDWVRVMSKNNIVLVSEQEAPLDFMPIWEQQVIRTQNNRKRHTTVEKVWVYNYDGGY